MIPFNIHKNFFLQPDGWGDVSEGEIISLLDNVISNFYIGLDKENVFNKYVIVAHSSHSLSNLETPIIYRREEMHTIFLATQGRYWSQYAYQFSHELCHHIINTLDSNLNDKFGWLEETFCELASLFTLLLMSNTWKVNPPYLNWKDYSSSLYSYVQNILELPENKIDEPFKTWLTKKLPLLFDNRYNRTANSIIAIQLLPLFIANPNLWQCIQYFKNVNVSKSDLKLFLMEWRNKIPPEFSNKFVQIENILP